VGHISICLSFSIIILFSWFLLFKEFIWELTLTFSSFIFDFSFFFKENYINYLSTLNTMRASPSG